MADKQQTQTSTQIRNFYSDGLSYMNMKFFNTNLSFSFYPFQGKNQNGRSTYDLKNGEVTTVDFKGAYALWKSCEDILNNRVQDIDLSIPCTNAELKLSRHGLNGLYDTTISITKNNRTITFKFSTIQFQEIQNGQTMTKTIDAELGAFSKTIEGYLTGINADLHLTKLTEDYAKLQQQQNNKQPNNYQKKNYNYNNYNRNYGNNQQYKTISTNDQFPN